MSIEEAVPRGLRVHAGRGNGASTRNALARGRQSTMRRLLIVSASLSLSLAGVAGVALAQENTVQGITTNADGVDVTSTAGLNPTANGEGGTIIYGDINTGPGYTVVEPPSVVRSGSTAPPPCRRTRAGSGNSRGAGRR